MLGVQPAFGRTFLPEEGQTPGKFPVMLISYSLWLRTFAGDPGIVGKQVELSGHSFTIIGVTPKSFSGVDLWFRPDVYLPMVMTAAVSPEGNDNLRTLADSECNSRAAQTTRPGVANLQDLNIEGARLIVHFANQVSSSHPLAVRVRSAAAGRDRSIRSSRLRRCATQT